ncbi:LysE family translocator [Halalkaliarchaeum desulfuricum]|uniref:LysE family translocator n=1 Tax=Halalkaliarchaeum desulfuricum TaxID=2055893 RepID=UPI000E6D3540|nr:LysE family translocator [Halalkaliarchaeum desulfuricum]
MVSTLSSLLLGTVFGLALAAPPGPMNAIIAEESVVRGWREGFMAGLGAGVADLLFFVLASVGVVAVVERFETLQAVMIGVGGLFMLYFAYDAIRSARASFRPTDGTLPESRGFRKALVLGLSNPYQILFWLTIGTALLRPGRVDLFAQVPYVGEALAGTVIVETGSAALVGGLFVGIGIWIVAYPAALVYAERRIDSMAPVVAVLSALVLVGFGVYFLSDAAATLLG